MKNVALFVSFVLATNLLQDAESKKMSFDEIREILQPVKQICIDRVGTDPTAPLAATSWKMIDDANKGKFVPDRKLQCYYKCMLVMGKIMTKDDQIRETTIINIVELMVEEQYQSPLMEAMLHCKSITDQPLEGCELAYELTKCLYEYNPMFMLFP